MIGRQSAQHMCAALLALTMGLGGADAADPFNQPLPETDRAAFERGRQLFRQAWVVAPAHDDSDFAGLGPVYNDISCVGCHVRNGRGSVPAGPGEPLHGLLLRLSAPGTTAQGGPAPLAAYGDQLEDHAIPGVPPEGSASLRYEAGMVALADGTRVRLRRPVPVTADLHFGSFPPGALTSLRGAQPVLGSGLLQAIPEADIRAEARRQAAARGPVHGRINRVWDIAKGGFALGRFGWKANQPSLAQQTAAAAFADMGLTSPLFPAKNCAAPQSACRAADAGPTPNLSATRLADLVAYLGGLAPPERRDADAAPVRRGEALFADLGCAVCHRPAWSAAGRAIHPYSDLLLHDMGDGLADGRPDFAASGRQWRTAPLWGLGLAREANPNSGLLHDGRARDPLEAILWHGGEAATVRRAVTRLSAASRADLLTFLNSL